MTRAARVYDFTMPAFGAAVILAEGSFYRLMSATGAVEVRRNNGSIVGPLLPGQGERAEFISLTITDKSGAANAGTILIADDAFIDERVSGEVSVIDGGLVRSMGQAAFMAVASLNASAGNYGIVQLWNPSATRWAAVSQVWLNSFSGGQNYEIRIASAPLATLVGAPPSKRTNGAASAMELRTDVLAAIPAGALLVKNYGPINTLAPWRFTEPLAVAPGTGLNVIGTTLNAHLCPCFDYFEFVPT